QSLHSLLSRFHLRARRFVRHCSPQAPAVGTDRSPLSATTRSPLEIRLLSRPPADLSPLAEVLLASISRAPFNFAAMAQAPVRALALSTDSAARFSELSHWPAMRPCRSTTVSLGRLLPAA